jgi:hypothetical protein
VTTSTTNRDPLIALADALRAYFSTVPGDIAVGLVGEQQAARVDNVGPGGANRILIIEREELATLERGQSSSSIGVNIEADVAFDVEVWAADPSTGGTDEQRQRAATWSLLEAVFQAFRRLVDPVTKQPIGYGNFHFGKLRRRASSGGPMFYGKALVFDATIKAYLADIAPVRGVGQAQIRAATFSKVPPAPPDNPIVPNLTGGS